MSAILLTTQTEKVWVLEDCAPTESHQAEDSGARIGAEYQLGMDRGGSRNAECRVGNEHVGEGDALNFECPGGVLRNESPLAQK